MEDKLWKDYPELTNEYRTPEEDMLSDEIVALFEKIYKYLKTFETNDVPILDLQGGIHLLQQIFITIQKRRFNERKLG